MNLNDFPNILIGKTNELALFVILLAVVAVVVFTGKGYIARRFSLSAYLSVLLFFYLDMNFNLFSFKSEFLEIFLLLALPFALFYWSFGKVNFYSGRYSLLAKFLNLLSASFMSFIFFLLFLDDFITFSQKTMEIFISAQGIILSTILLLLSFLTM